MRKGIFALSLAMLVQSIPASAESRYGISEGNEELLLQGLEELARQRPEEALESLRELTSIRPDFKLAQLVYADLLAARVGQKPRLVSEDDKGIQGMLDEARVRMKMDRDRIGPDMIPASLVQMSAEQKHLILIDTTYSRLFLFENRNGQPYLIKDYYASYGRGGVRKEKEGDLKTPLGVYFVTGRLLDKNLPSRYGSGALPINYPNAWDKRHKRTGYGIWVHGSPVETYSRPPKASEGCISLTNPDFLELDRLVDSKTTPVLIGENINWLTRSEWQQQQKQYSALVEKWRQDWESLDHQKYIAHYSAEFSNGKQNFNQFSSHKRRVNANKEFVEVGVRDLNIFTYPDNPNLMVASFTQHYRSSNYHGDSVKRQYWIREQGNWKIAYEGKPSPGRP